MKNSEREQLKAIIKQLYDALDECQFADNSGGEYDACCPVCEETVGWDGKHKPGCKIAAALKAALPFFPAENKTAKKER